MTGESASNKTGVGARMRRKEDDRFLHGRGQYIGDLRFARMREVAFVRSPVAHARLTGVHIPDHVRPSVFIAEDLADVRGMVCLICRGTPVTEGGDSDVIELAVAE